MKMGVGDPLIYVCVCLAYWYPALQDASTASPTGRACVCLAVLCVQSCFVLRDPLFLGVSHGPVGGGRGGEDKGGGSGW
jgi:hypothetical protein